MDDTAGERDGPRPIDLAVIGLGLALLVLVAGGLFGALRDDTPARCAWPCQPEVRIDLSGFPAVAGHPLSLVCLPGGDCLQLRLCLHDRACTTVRLSATVVTLPLPSPSEELVVDSLTVTDAGGRAVLTAGPARIRPQRVPLTAPDCPPFCLVAVVAVGADGTVRET